jgi:hypothetical protein
VIHFNTDPALGVFASFASCLHCRLMDTNKFMNRRAERLLALHENISSLLTLGARLAKPV